MEEFQTIAKSQQIGSVVLPRIIRTLPVHSRMVFNAEASAGIKCSSRGRSFRPRNWSFVEGKWQEKEDFFNSVVTQTRCILNRFR